MGLPQPQPRLDQYYQSPEANSCGGPVQQVLDLLYQLETEVTSGGNTTPSRAFPFFVG